MLRLHRWVFLWEYVTFSITFWHFHPKTSFVAASMCYCEWLFFLLKVQTFYHAILIILSCWLMAEFESDESCEQAYFKVRWLYTYIFLAQTYLFQLAWLIIYFTCFISFLFSPLPRSQSCFVFFVMIADG